MTRRLVAALAIGVLLCVVAAGCDGPGLNQWRVEHGMAPLAEPQLSQGVTFVNAWLAEAQRRNSFVGDIQGVDAARLGLSWHPGCPVSPSDLRLLRLSYWGFDNAGHTGELIVNAKIAPKMVTVFHDLWNEKFPIQTMVTSDAYLTPAMFDANGNYIEQPNTPDTVDATSGFMCRKTTRASSWSQHAYGLAVDINPVQNPYIVGSLVIPLNGTYNGSAPGTVTRGGLVFASMTRNGMGWGGNFKALKDYMHFSLNGK